MLLAFFVGLALILGLDQLTKYVAVLKLAQVRTLPLIPEVFHLTYVENSGAGFGIFQNFTWLLAAFSAVVAAILIGYVLWKKPKHPCLFAALTFLCGGALGNLVDRIRLGYVVDFLDFTLIDFPVFNVADCFVTVGAILLAVYIIWFSEDGKNTEKTGKTEKTENTLETDERE